MGTIPPREKEDFAPTYGSPGNDNDTNFYLTTVSTDARSYQSKILSSMTKPNTPYDTTQPLHPSIKGLYPSS